MFPDLYILIFYLYLTCLYYANNLKICIKGFVVEYDVCGLRRTKSQIWGQCLSIKVLPHLTSLMQSYWDDVLLKTFLGNSWTSDRYVM